MKDLLLVAGLLILFVLFARSVSMFEPQCPPEYDTVPGVSWAGHEYTCQPIGNDSTLVNTIPVMPRAPATCGEPAFILDV